MGGEFENFKSRGESRNVKWSECEYPWLKVIKPALQSRWFVMDVRAIMKCNGWNAVLEVEEYITIHHQHAAEAFNFTAVYFCLKIFHLLARSLYETYLSLCLCVFLRFLLEWANDRKLKPNVEKKGPFGKTRNRRSVYRRINSRAIATMSAQYAFYYVNTLLLNLVSVLETDERRRDLQTEERKGILRFIIDKMKYFSLIF